MVRPDARVRWSLDPVDGTRALICGLPSWAVLVGLLEDGRHIAGMIDLPAGGHVGNWAGGNDLSVGSVIAAASRQLYDQAVRLLSDHSAIG